MADYTAKRDLYIGFTKARNKGDKVTAAEVKKYGWEDAVEKVEKPKPTTEPTA